MLYMLMMMNLMLSFTFLFMKHPLSMGFILLIQTIIISMITGFMTYSYWFSYILFLIMLGGMLVLFIYMTSLASNELFSYSSKLSMTIFFFILIFITLFLIIDKMNLIPMIKNSSFMEMNNSIMFMKNELLVSLNKIYNKPNFMITIILINYLFLTLIAVVKITNINQGPLRQKF
uniref:NADH-ubiquinone oxidoreductase chain 6 n=1 Tax=Macrogyrus oblongus TaxID=528226 RepID=C8YXB4_9COLE|nr:NADH dehydrogenase subunit 6 [Macrogyrus oblongus]ACO92548.1 NADH dehydrogenase subunit 6 [Macrogyrus oblongus]